MRTARACRGLLFPLVAFVTIAAAVAGQAANESGIVAAAREGDLPAFAR
jgi:hypothetical protein